MHIAMPIPPPIQREAQPLLLFSLIISWIKVTIILAPDAPIGWPNAIAPPLTLTIFFGILENKNNKRLNISFVTKKKIGNAVKRNKIKRRLRNIINNAVKKISIKFNYSYLVIAKSTMLNNEYKNIKETLFQDLEKIK